MLAFALALACSQSTGEPQQTGEPLQGVQETPQTPPPEWSDVDRAISELEGSRDFSEPGLHVGGYIAIAGLYSRTSDIQAPDDLSGFSLNAARFWFEGAADGWYMHIGFRGEQYTDPIPEGQPGGRLFGVAGEAGPIRPEEMYVGHEFIEDGKLDARIGRMHVPLLTSGLYEGNRLLFDHRTFNGEVIAFPRELDEGVVVTSHLGPFRAWAAVQNGHDDTGNEMAYTLRGMWDVFGVPAQLENEGALNAPEGVALSVGGAVYYDTLDDNYSTQALEGQFTWSRLSAAAEIVDYGNGLGQELYSWGVTGSFLVLDTVEIAARYESADRDDGPYLTRLGVNKYFEGHDVKLQAVYTTADSNARLVDVDLFSLGLVASF